MSEQLFAFVLMPFSSEFDDVYKLGIKETSSKLNIRAERVDEQIYSEGILERIYRQIDAADIIIADMTGQNPNVFYEVGYAHAKDKICILLTSNADDIPFDLKHRRHIIYGKSIDKLREQLSEDLLWARRETENIQKTHITVSVKSIYADLEKTKYTAKAKLEFKIDLLNESNKVSPDIESAYIFSGDRWSVAQDGKLCPSTKSDVAPFSLKHFLTVPVRKLRKGQWAQLIYESTKNVATAFNGEELKDSYKIQGKGLLRLVTSEGDFDYEFNISVEAEEFPF